MTEATRFADELYTLSDAACDGALSDTEFERLEILLSGNVEAQQYYLSHLCLDRWLGWEYAHETKFAEPTEIEAIPSFPADTLGGPVGYFASGWPLAYFVATLVFAVGIILGLLTQVSHPRQSIARKTAEKPDESSSVRMTLVGRITAMADCTWADETTAAFLGSRVPLDRKYALSGGLMEITYDGGAKVVLQGPCAYEVKSANSGYLAAGKLTARVEKQLVGGKLPVASNGNHKSLPPGPCPLFSIKTPTATVTDLGTEFGVEVGADSTTRTHVFSGRVTVESLAEGSPGKGPRVLNAGQTAEVNRGKAVLMIEVQPQFVRNMPTMAPPVGPDEYAKIVLAMQPALYFRMEQPTDKNEQKLVADLAGGHHGNLVSDVEPVWLPGRFGQSVFFRGNGGCRAVIVPDYPKAEADQLTVSAWVLAESRPNNAFIAVNWRQSMMGQFHFGLYKEDGDLAVSVNHAARGKDRSSQVFAREGQDRPFPLFQWQHVAFVCDKTVLRLYRNGIETASTACRGIGLNPKVASLVIGCRTDDNGALQVKECWNGRIDELAIFNRELSTAEIRQLSAQPRIKN